MESLHASWFRMWVFPKQTIQKIISIRSHYGLFFLAFLTGSPGVFRSFFLERTSVDISSMTGLILSLILSFIWGYVMFYFFGWFLFKTQRWFQKEEEVPYSFFRAGFAWSSIPSSGTCIIWLILFLITEFVHPVNLTHKQIGWINWFSIVMGVYTFVLLTLSLSQIERISIGKSILHAFVGVIFASLALTVIALIISLFIPFLLNTL